MKWILVVLAMLLVGGQVEAQCAAADSLLGPVKGWKAPAAKYDAMADTTQVDDMYLSEHAMNRDAGAAQFSSFFAGKSLKGSSVSVLVIQMDQRMVNPTAVQRIRGDKTLFGGSVGKYRYVTEILFLLDDSVSFRVPVVSHTANTKEATFGGGQHLLENLTVQITQDDLLRIAKAQKGTMRVKDYDFNFKEKQTDNLKNAIRYLTCGGAV